MNSAKYVRKSIAASLTPAATSSAAQLGRNGYESQISAGHAFASAAAAAALSRDEAVPLLAAKGTRIDSRRGKASRSGYDEGKYLSTYREVPAPKKPSMGAWMPGGKSGSSASSNIIANKNNVYRSAKLSLSKAPLNHYNRLHMSQLQ
eukprot:GSChrysophyteH1.ASY1.ANO1.414.1 assembled CDS